MRFSARKLLVLLIVAGTAVVTTGASLGHTLLIPQEIVDRIVAVVDLEVITLSEAEQARRVRLMREDSEWTLVEAVERLIERFLIEREVQRNPGDPLDESVVSEAVEGIRREFVSPSAYQDALKSHEMREADLRSEIRRQLTVTEYLNQRFRALVYVTEEEIEVFYDKELSEELAPGEPPPLSEVAPQIESILSERKFNDRVDAWIENLKERVEIRRYVW